MQTSLSALLKASNVHKKTGCGTGTGRFSPLIGLGRWSRLSQQITIADKSVASYACKEETGLRANHVEHLRGEAEAGVRKLVDRN